MNKISNLKAQKIKGNADNKNRNVYFEQRVDNLTDRKNYYFHQPAKWFPLENKLEINDIIRDMRGAIKDCGIGLAHNQLPQKNNMSNPYAVCVIEFDSENIDQNVPFQELINPVLVGFSNDSIKFLHGCLSALEYPRGDILTYKNILVAYYTKDLDKVNVKYFDSMAAIIVQHELRHLFNSDTYVEAAADFFNYQDELLQKYYLLSNAKNELITLDKIDDKIKLPTLMTDEIIARCKIFLQNNPEYHSVVLDYLNKNPQDRYLYDNFLAVSTNLSGNCI